MLSPVFDLYLSHITTAEWIIYIKILPQTKQNQTKKTCKILPYLMNNQAIKEQENHLPISNQNISLRTGRQIMCYNASHKHVTIHLTNTYLSLGFQLCHASFKSSHLSKNTGISCATIHLTNKYLNLEFQLYRTSFNGSQLAKGKRIFLTCPCHKTYRDESVGLKSCKYTWKIMKFVKMWNLGQYRINLIFRQ